MLRIWLSLFLAFTGQVFAADHPIDRIHFLIPGGPGGGWDNTARSVGMALQSAGLISQVSYENLSGGGGGRAIARLIETADRQQNTLMVNSTPIVVRSLQKVFPQSFRDLTPIVTMIADTSCFVVRSDSDIPDWPEVIRRLKADVRSIKVAGGSVRGSTDHLITALATRAAGIDPRKVVYIPYDAGGKAMAGLLSGETALLSTGLSEAIDMAEAGEVRILTIAAENRVPRIADVPTLKELGWDVVFANWRGFFGPPGLADDHRLRLLQMFQRLLATPEFAELVERNGWQAQYHGGDDFYKFLEREEDVVGAMMRELGFLRPVPGTDG